MGIWLQDLGDGEAMWCQLGQGDGLRTPLEGLVYRYQQHLGRSDKQVQLLLPRHYDNIWLDDCPADLGMSSSDTLYCHMYEVSNGLCESCAVGDRHVTR